MKIPTTSTDSSGPRLVCACRRNAASPAPTAPGTRLARRSGGAVAWALPSVALALVPKCPMCIAAYLALGGGLGISLKTASHLRTTLIWICWSVLALLTVRVAVRLAKSHIVAAARVALRKAWRDMWRFLRRAAFPSISSSIPLRSTMYGYIKQGHRQQT